MFHGCLSLPVCPFFAPGLTRPNLDEIQYFDFFIKYMTDPHAGNCKGDKLVPNILIKIVCRINFINMLVNSLIWLLQYRPIDPHRLNVPVLEPTLRNLCHGPWQWHFGTKMVITEKVMYCPVYIALSIVCSVYKNQIMQSAILFI